MPSAKTALVTGGAVRLGAAFVLDLAKRGWKVWIHYRGSENEARSLNESLEGSGLGLVQADLAETGGAEAMIRAVSKYPPSLIVHSASTWLEDTVSSAQAEQWERSHRLHVWSAVVFARALAGWALPGTQLVTLLDSRLRDSDASHFSYAFAKRELAQLTRYLASEFAPTVRVNGIAPGLVLRADDVRPSAWAKAGRESTPLGRAGKPADVVRALRYLTDNTYVTGQILTVDGGRHLKGDLFGSV